VHRIEPEGDTVLIRDLLKDTKDLLGGDIKFAVAAAGAEIFALCLETGHKAEALFADDRLLMAASPMARVGLRCTSLSKAILDGLAHLTNSLGLAQIPHQVKSLPGLL
jgi:hypothetical protein